MLKVNYTLENETGQDLMLICSMEHASKPSLVHLPAGETVAFFDHDTITAVKIFTATPEGDNDVN